MIQVGGKSRSFFSFKITDKSKDKNHLPIIDLILVFMVT
jgi:hypothetical protein